MTHIPETLPYEGILLTPSLFDGQEARAIKVLRYYFTPIRWDEGRLKYRGNLGGGWDTFNPSNTRAESVNTFTADDVLALLLLSLSPNGYMAKHLLELQKAEFDGLLRAIGPDRDFVELESAVGEQFRPVRELYEALRHVPKIGETTATKLLARKRPRLVPIVDKVIRRDVFNNRAMHWQPLHQALTAHDNRLHRRLVQFRKGAGLPETVSALRIFDVLAWMDGTGNSERAVVDTPVVSPEL